MPSRKESISSCQKACPAGVDIPQYVRLIKDGRFGKAFDVIHSRIPFPMVCSFVCAHPCEANCARAQFDEAVSIRRLKRMAVEKGGRKLELTKLPRTGKRLAIIGSGPCGLSAAYYLNLMGHAVIVFEALPQLGGMLRYCIPEFRLPEKALDQEISFLRSLGIEFRSNECIDSPETLLASGYDAVFVATGAWKSTSMGIEGEDLPDTMDGIHFLRQMRQGKAPPSTGGRVVVVGGGNTAIDAARAAVRFGAAVEIVYRRSLAEMPASHEEIQDAIEEGVIIRPLTLPVKIAKGQIVCVDVRSKEIDANGRGVPEPIWGSEHSLPFDVLIMAIGQTADAESIKLEESRKGMVYVDRDTLATSIKGVFAGGDAVTGPSSIIEAIAQGRQASESIDRYLGGAGAIPENSPADLNQPYLQDTAVRGALRRPVGKIDLQKRRTTFEVVEQVYVESEAVAEASRCLSCDLREFEVEINGAICKDCGYCREICSLDVFSKNENFNALGFRPANAKASEKCVGCLRCLYICPDFAITVKDRCSSQNQ